MVQFQNLFPPLPPDVKWYHFFHLTPLFIAAGLDIYKPDFTPYIIRTLDYLFPGPIIIEPYVIDYSALELPPSPYVNSAAKLENVELIMDLNLYKGYTIHDQIHFEEPKCTTGLCPYAKLQERQKIPYEFYNHDMLYPEPPSEPFDLVTLLLFGIA